MDFNQQIGRMEEELTELKDYVGQVKESVNRIENALIGNPLDPEPHGLLQRVARLEKEQKKYEKAIWLLTGILIVIAISNDFIKSIITLLM